MLNEFFSNTTSVGDSINTNDIITINIFTNASIKERQELRLNPVITLMFVLVIITKIVLCLTNKTNNEIS